MATLNTLIYVFAQDSTIAVRTYECMFHITERIHLIWSIFILHETQQFRYTVDYHVK